MSGYDFDRPFVSQEALRSYTAMSSGIAARYGRTVKAIQLSNSEYNIRFHRFSSQNSMKPPPSAGRIFSGYLVIRKLGTPDQYETWMPADVFEELYTSEVEKPLAPRL
jgi:hypothetical protein